MRSGRISSVLPSVPEVIYTRTVRCLLSIIALLLVAAALAALLPVVVDGQAAYSVYPAAADLYIGQGDQLPGYFSFIPQASLSAIRTK